MLCDLKDVLLIVGAVNVIAGILYASLNQPDIKYYASLIIVPRYTINTLTPGTYTFRKYGSEVS
ncbi:MAG TPA: hypothetical protein ENG05_00960 [Acidilobales archaeon]|nr:hypothetical protein [Acidilobales archaeon]